MNPKYRAIIVDDERLARNDLKILLAEFDQIDIIGEAENISTAEKMIRRQKPDVVFLDIQLTGESGFDLIERMEILPKIIL